MELNLFYSDECVELNESISGPRDAISKGSKRYGERHVLNTLSHNHQFLHRNFINTWNQKPNIQIRVSSIWLLLTMTAKGAAYIIMLKTMQVVPTMADRFFAEWTRINVTNARTPMKRSSTTSHIRTLSLLLRLE